MAKLEIDDLKSKIQQETKNLESKLKPQSNSKFKNLYRKIRNKFKVFGYRQIHDLFLGKKKTFLPFRFLSLLFGVLSLLFVLFLIPVIYFLILLYAEPRSIPAINMYLEQKINEGSGIIFSMEDMKISLNNDLHIVVQGKDVNVRTAENNLNFPDVSLEFKLHHLISGNFRAHVISISKSRLTLYTNGEDKQGDLKEKGYEKILEKVHSIVESISKTKKAPKNLVFKDTIVDIYTESDQVATYKKNIIVLPRTSLRVEKNISDTDFEINSVFFLDNKHEMTTVQMFCNISWTKTLSCETMIQNLEPVQYSVFAASNPVAFDYLSNLEGKINGDAFFSIDSDYELDKLKFNLISKVGSFHYKQFFPNKIAFEELEVSGGGDNSLKHFQLKEVKAKLNNVDYSMSLKLEKDENSKPNEMLMKFRAKNLPGKQLKNLWPLSLNKNGIRDWVMEHLKDGHIPEAYADMYMEKNEETGRLKTYRVDSEVKFKDVLLDYNKNYPVASRLGGTAYFTRDNMRIEVISGRALSSNLKNVEIGIRDLKESPKIFYAKGEMYGKSNDVYNHIKYKGSFDDIASYYMEGNARTNFSIEIPMIKKPSLYQIKTDVITNIKNINTDYLTKNSEINLVANKKANESLLAVKVDLEKANLLLPKTNFIKLKKSNATLDVEMLAPKNENELFEIPKILLSGNNIKVDAGAVMTNKGDVLLSFDSKAIKYGRHNFKISFKDKSIVSSGKNENGKDMPKLDTYFIGGDSLDLISIMRARKNYVKTTSLKHPKPRTEEFAVNLKLKSLMMENGYEIRDVVGGLICQNDNFCDRGEINGFISEEKDGNWDQIKLSLEQEKPTDKYKRSRFKLTFDDLGIVSKMLNATDLIKGGETSIKGTISKSKTSDFQKIEGTAKVKSEFIILNSYTLTKIFIDKLPDSTTFKSLKELLNKDNYMEFKSAEAKFKIKGNDLKVEKLVTNATKMGLGITAAGEHNLKTGSIDLEGFIVPIQKINTLLGLGNVPIIGGVLGKGGGLFAIRFTYEKKDMLDDGNFELYKKSAIAPGPLKNLFSIGN